MKSLIYFYLNECNKNQGYEHHKFFDLYFLVHMMCDVQHITISQCHSLKKMLYFAILFYGYCMSNWFYPNHFFSHKQIWLFGSVKKINSMPNFPFFAEVMKTLFGKIAAHVLEISLISFIFDFFQV